MSISQQTHISLKPAISFRPVVTGTLQRACCNRDRTAIGDRGELNKKNQMLEHRAICPYSQTICSRSDDGIGFSGMQRKSAISEPGDQYEMEADRIADEVVNQDRAGNASFIHHSGLPLLQRQEKSSPQPSQEEQYKNAAEKAGEAFLKTDLGRDIKDKALKQGKDFISTLRGKIITGAAAAGVVSTLAATNSKLPMQVPEIPLDFITPGLKVKLNYEGPVRNPTSASLTFTYVEQVQKKEKKGEPTEREKFRAETARIAEDQARFREGLKTPEQRAAEHDQFINAYWGRKNRLGLDPIRIPDLGDERKKPALRMRDERPKGEEEGLQRKANSSRSLIEVPPLVNEVIRSSSEGLDSKTQSFMRESFGYDFGKVKVHTNEKAAKSALAVDAKAYTMGDHVVFGAGNYAPSTMEGKKLLTHELVHVMQQYGSAIRVPLDEAGSKEWASIKVPRWADKFYSCHPLLFPSSLEPPALLRQHQRKAGRKDRFSREEKAQLRSLGRGEIDELIDQIIADGTYHLVRREMINGTTHIWEVKTSIVELSEEEQFRGMNYGGAVDPGKDVADPDSKTVRHQMTMILRGGRASSIESALHELIHLRIAIDRLLPAEKQSSFFDDYSQLNEMTEVSESAKLDATANIAQKSSYGALPIISGIWEKEKEVFKKTDAIRSYLINRDFKAEEAFDKNPEVKPAALMDFIVQEKYVTQTAATIVAKNAQKKAPKSASKDAQNSTRAIVPSNDVVAQRYARSVVSRFRAFMSKQGLERINSSIGADMLSDLTDRLKISIQALYDFLDEKLRQAREFEENPPSTPAGLPNPAIIESPPLGIDREPISPNPSS